MSFRDAVTVPESHAEWFVAEVLPHVPDTRPFDHAGHLADLFPEVLQLALIEVWVEGPRNEVAVDQLDQWMHRMAYRLKLDEKRRGVEDESVLLRQVHGGETAYAGDSYIVQECIYLCSPKYQRLIELMMLRDMDVSKAARELGMPQQTASDWWHTARQELKAAYVTVISRSR